MTLDVKAMPRLDWSPVPYDGCRNVESRTLLRNEQASVAMLRFAKDATIHEHAAPMDIDVICLEGEGMTSIDGESASIEMGRTVRWPAGAKHRLWTEGSEMTTLMIEHIGTIKRS